MLIGKLTISWEDPNYGSKLKPRAVSQSGQRYQRRMERYQAKMKSEGEEGQPPTGDSTRSEE
jgi:hypothetical protein